MAWTRHGHQILGTIAEEGDRPPIARCGGPTICTACALDVTRAHERMKENSPPTDSSKMVGRYRKKPVEIDAIQLRWDTWPWVCEFAGVGLLSDGKPQGCWVHPTDNSITSEYPIHDQNPTDQRIGLHIPTLEGLMLAVQDDYIIKGVQGELYPCKPDIFADTYEKVN